MVETSLILPVVQSEDLGPKNEKLEQHLTRVEAGETLRKAEQEYQKGNVQEAKAQIQQYKICKVAEGISK